MKITEKQFLIMLRVLEGSLYVNDLIDIFGYDRQTRKKFYEEILNQQSDVSINIEEDPLNKQGQSKKQHL